MAKDPKNLESLQSANPSQNAKRDEILKRMLRMKPHPHGKKLRKSQLDLADSEESASDISDGNLSGKATDRSDD